MSKTYFLKFLVSILCVSLWSQVFAQENAYRDSLLQELQHASEDTNKVYLLDRIAETYQRTDTNQFFQYVAEYRKLAEKLHFNVGIAMSYFRTGNFQLNYKEDFPKALEDLEKARYFISTTNRKRLNAIMFQSIGLVYERSGDYQKALEYYIKSVEIHEAINGKRDMGVTYNAIGVVYFYMKQYEKATDYYKQALDIWEELNDPIEASYSYNNLGIICRKQGEYEKAMEYYSQSLDIKTQVNDRKGMAYTLGNIGLIHTDQGNYAQALVFHRKALKIIRELGSYLGVSRYLGNIAYNYSEMGEHDSAIVYAKQGLAAAKEKNITEGKKTVYGILAYSSYDLGKSDDAFKYMELYMKTKDTLINESNSEKLAELEARYQNEKKKKEIALLNREKEVQDLKFQRQKSRQYYLVGIAVLLLAVAILFINRYRYKQKSNQQLQEKNRQVSAALKERETLLKEIHHRVKNNLQIISSLLNLQSRHIEDQQALEAVKEGQNRVKSMALIHQEIYQKDNLTEINAGHYITNLVQGLLKSYELSAGAIELETDIDELELDVDTTIPLGLIINELVTNTVKYAFPDKKEGKLSVTLKKKEDSLLLTVSDNGVGIPKGFDLKKARSFGLKLVHSLARKLEATVSLREGKGTTIDMEIKNFKTAAA